MKKVIRMSFVFFSSPSLLHPSCGLFVCQPSSAHPPPKTPAPPPRPACETKKRTKKQKKNRQKLNLIPYQKKPFLEKSKIFNLENDRKVLAFLGVRAVCFAACGPPGALLTTQDDQTVAGGRARYPWVCDGFPEAAGRHHKKQQVKGESSLELKRNFQKDDRYEFLNTSFRANHPLF